MTFYTLTKVFYSPFAPWNRNKSQPSVQNARKGFSFGVLLNVVWMGWTRDWVLIDIVKESSSFFSLRIWKKKSINLCSASIQIFSTLKDCSNTKKSQKHQLFVRNNCVFSDVEVQKVSEFSGRYVFFIYFSIYEISIFFRFLLFKYFIIIYFLG